MTTPANRTSRVVPPRVPAPGEAPTGPNGAGAAANGGATTANGSGTSANGASDAGSATGPADPKLPANSQLRAHDEGPTGDHAPADFTRTADLQIPADVQLPADDAEHPADDAEHLADAAEGAEHAADSPIRPVDRPDRRAAGPEAKRSRRRARLWKLAALSVAVLVLAVLTLRGRFPSVPHILATIADANWAWVAVALGMQAISILMFALQERVLLAGLGVRIRIRRITAIALSRTALSISLPAGAAVSAGYAVREYRRAGAPNEVAAAVMIVAGLVSIAGLAAVYVCGVLGVVAQAPAEVLTSPGPLAVLGLFAIILIASAVRRLRGGRPAPRTGPRPEPRRAWTRYARKLLDAGIEAWRAGASLKPQHWAISLAYAAANWLFDLLCLAGSTRALGLPIGVTTLAGIYLGVQVVRQIPITPGGVGLIETAFIAGLTAAGTSAASATAAVLIYRVLSCWLLLPVGGLAAFLLRGAHDWSATPRDAKPAA